MNTSPSKKRSTESDTVDGCYLIVDEEGPRLIDMEWESKGKRRDIGKFADSDTASRILVGLKREFSANKSRPVFFVWPVEKTPQWLRDALEFDIDKQDAVIAQGRAREHSPIEILRMAAYQEYARAIAARHTERHEADSPISPAALPEVRRRKRGETSGSSGLVPSPRTVSNNYRCYRN